MHSLTLYEAELVMEGLAYAHTGKSKSKKIDMASHEADLAKMFQTGMIGRKPKKKNG